jgi:ectoine hydroxylase-related dioxygenase (phytanoyl-CoA dioxygenase family)
VTNRLDFDRDGVAVLESVVGQNVVQALEAEFDTIDIRAGARPFALTKTVASLIGATGVLTWLARSLCGREARPVRVLAFDKTPATNWRLPWHQDRVVAVAERHDVPSFGSWSVKDGVPHAEPPLPVLQAMFSLRLHLDPCDRENGALTVVPGSWTAGRLKEAEVRTLAESQPPAVCEAQSGDVVAMRALTIHASDAAPRPSHRRVLHVDYCWAPLPPPLRWALDFDD